MGYEAATPGLHGQALTLMRNLPMQIAHAVLGGSAVGSFCTSKPIAAMTTLVCDTCHGGSPLFPRTGEQLPVITELTPAGKQAHLTEADLQEHLGLYSL